MLDGPLAVEAKDFAGEVFGISGTEEPQVALVGGDEFGNAAVVAGDKGHAAGMGFGADAAEPFKGGRKDEKVEGTVEIGQKGVVAFGLKGDAVLPAAFSDIGFADAAGGTGADEGKVPVGNQRGTAPEGFEEGEVAFLGNEIGDAADAESGVGAAQRRGEAGGVDAVVENGGGAEAGRRPVLQAAELSFVPGVGPADAGNGFQRTADGFADAEVEVDAFVQANEVGPAEAPVPEKAVETADVEAEGVAAVVVQKGTAAGIDGFDGEGVGGKEGGVGVADGYGFGGYAGAAEAGKEAAAVEGVKEEGKRGAGKHAVGKADDVDPLVGVVAAGTGHENPDVVAAGPAEGRGKVVDVGPAPGCRRWEVGGDNEVGLHGGSIACAEFSGDGPGAMRGDDLRRGSKKRAKCRAIGGRGRVSVGRRGAYRRRRGGL